MIEIRPWHVVLCSIYTCIHIAYIHIHMYTVEGGLLWWYMYKVECCRWGMSYHTYMIKARVCIRKYPWHLLYFIPGWECDWSGSRQLIHIGKAICMYVYSKQKLNLLHYLPQVHGLTDYIDSALQTSPLTEWYVRYQSVLFHTTKTIAFLNPQSPAHGD